MDYLHRIRSGPFSSNIYMRCASNFSILKGNNAFPVLTLWSLDMVYYIYHPWCMYRCWRVESPPIASFLVHTFGLPLNNRVLFLASSLKYMKIKHIVMLSVKRFISQFWSKYSFQNSNTIWKYVIGCHPLTPIMLL